MSRKKQKVSNDCFELVDFCYRSSSEKVLSDLPDEILTEILGYLTPESLVQISNLRIQRLTGAAFIKSADFSLCNTINLVDLQSFFIEERLNLIQEINFNNVFSALPSTLTTCILKCKNITRLYVFNCGLELSHISSIFNGCKVLQECYWSFLEDDGYVRFQKPSSTVKSNSLKKLCLQLQEEDDLNINNLIHMCPNVETVYLNYTPCYTTSVPTKLPTRYFYSKSIKKDRNEALNVVQMCLSNASPAKVQLYMQGIFMVMDVNQVIIRPDCFPFDETSTTNDLFLHSSLLQIFAQKDRLDDLPQLPDESVNSLVIIMNENLNDLVPHLKSINRMTGKALNHLSVCKHEFARLTDADPEEYYSISTVLCDIIEHSVNITELILAELHTRNIFLLPTNCPLKNLKVLILSACCLAVPKIKHEDSGIQKWQNNTSCERHFQDFVLNCKNVEEFRLYGCKTCFQGPTDEMMIPISLWEKLKHLTLGHVRTVRKCQFLIHVANKCPKLKVLELVQLSEGKMCHFIPNVIHILKKSKELVFLRINQPGFYPMEPLFWKSVESAQNLQGLCLATALTTYIENKPILEALNKLPYIHLFHMRFRRACCNLKTNVKRIMWGKGVKIPNIKIPIDCGKEFYDCCSRHLAI